MTYLQTNKRWMLTFYTHCNWWKLFREFIGVTFSASHGCLHLYANEKHSKGSTKKRNWKHLVYHVLQSRLVSQQYDLVEGAWARKKLVYQVRLARSYRWNGGGIGKRYFNIYIFICAVNICSAVSQAFWWNNLFILTWLICITFARN